MCNLRMRDWCQNLDGVIDSMLKATEVECVIEEAESLPCISADESADGPDLQHYICGSWLKRWD